MVPFHPLLGEGSPTKIDYRKKGALFLTSLLEDLANQPQVPEVSGFAIIASRNLLVLVRRCWCTLGDFWRALPAGTAKVFEGVLAVAWSHGE